MRVTSIQLEIRDGRSKAQTLEYVLAQLERARGSDLILLPELWSVGYFSFERYEAESEGLDGPTVRALGAQAARMQCHVLMGSLVERDGAALYNTTVLLDASGKVAARYRKIHLFGYGSEERRLLSRGQELVVAPTPWGRAGLATCYDLRFPELFRGLLDQGAEFFLIASAWPQARLESWRLFTRARAHENLAFLFACNCAGQNAGRTFAGHSQAVDPMGTVLACGGEGEELVSCEADMSRLVSVRKEFPALQDRVLQADKRRGAP